WFVLRASRTDRLRFWKAYADCRQKFDVTYWRLELAGELEKLTPASNLRLWRSWRNRCFGNNRRFVRLQDRIIRGHAILVAVADQLRPLLADSDRPFREASALLLKNSRSSRVTELDFSYRVGAAWMRTPPVCSGGLRIQAPPALPNPQN